MPRKHTTQEVVNNSTELERKEKNIMKLSHEDRKSLVAWVLREGMSLDYGKLSLCDLRNFRHSAVYDNRRYQVHSDDSRYPWSGIYDEIEPAIEKFLELKRKVRRMK